MYVCMYACVYIYIYVCVCVCVCVCESIDRYIHAHIASERERDCYYQLLHITRKQLEHVTIRYK